MSLNFLVPLARSSGFVASSLASLLWSLPMSAPVHAAEAAPVPVEAFFKRAKFRGAELAPGGRWLAVLTSAPKTRIGISIIDLEGKDAPRFIEASTAADVDWVSWVNDEWLVFTIEDADQRSNERRGRGLMAVKRDGSESRMLIQRQFEIEDPFRKRKTLSPYHSYIGPGALGSNDVVIDEWKFDDFGNFTHAAFLNLNVATGGTRSLYQEGPKAQSVMLDGTGKARALWHTSEGVTTLYWSDTGDAPWRQIAKNPTYAAGFSPLYVESADSLVVAGEINHDGVLRRFDLKLGKMAGDPILRTPGFSAWAQPVMVRGSHQVLGVRLITDAESAVWFVPEMQKLQDVVDAKLPGRVNRISCSPCDKPKVVLVESYADQLPTQYLLHRPQENRWQLIGEDRPDIEASRMASLELVRTKARDGADLPVWITRPTGAAKQPAPAVVMVHGGPYARGSVWGWHADAQFLASRGYVVIEPEFRGSTGYGYQHFKAGWKQWGLAMQDDVTDALKYAVAQGLVDPKRVCIVGGSYGGYASLMGLIKDPDQYRCGVAFAAVTDLRVIPKQYWSDISFEYRDYGFPLLVGDLTKDADRLTATSPVEHADRIKAPVLLVHGLKDRRVPIEHGERMRDALQKAGKKFEWVTYPDEGHGFAREENAIDYWKRVEAFLAQNLK
jgi:dipeptidyl aminopeptidase/acylaminoacyl peptidase